MAQFKSDRFGIWCPTLVILTWILLVVGASGNELESPTPPGQTDVRPPRFHEIVQFLTRPWEKEKDHKLYETLARSRAADRKISFADYCRSWRNWESANCEDFWPRVGYCDNTAGHMSSWSVWPEVVQAGKYAGGSLAVVILEGDGQFKPPPMSAVVVAHNEKDPPDLITTTTTHSVLLPGHFRWGEEVSAQTVVYLPAPQSPERWCRVWATGSRMIVRKEENYTVIHTAEEIISNESPQSADLLLPPLREILMVPGEKCTAFGFRHKIFRLERVNAEIVECGDALKSILSTLPAPGSYFCADLDQQMHFIFAPGVGSVFHGGRLFYPWTPWEVPKERRWPIFCQHWTTSNNVEGSGTYLLAGFLRHLHVTNERAVAVFTYFDF